MKTTLALLILGLGALALAGPAHFEKHDWEYKVADKTFLAKEKDLLRLFKFIFQRTYYKDQAEVAQKWQFEENVDLFTNPKVVKEFLHYWKEGFLPRGEVFSVFYEHHREEAKALFKVFYYAKDWETFYKVACWAREHVNEGMFVYAIHAAVFHRDDLQGMVLPPIYEIYPYFFVNSEVIDKAYYYKMRYSGDVTKDHTYYIKANYSGWYMNVNPLQKDLSYFTEDVGLNSYYYYFNLDYPFWLGGEEFGLEKDRRGELFYWVHQQILARYYLERLSNGYGSIPVFDWEEIIKTGFVPSLRYPNGLEFPVRPAFSHLVYNPHNQPYTVTGEDSMFRVQEIEDYERRIRDTIDFGYVYTDDGKKINIFEKEGFDLLGKIIESNPDSPNTRFYGDLMVLAHQVLGYSAHPVHEYKVVPSALEQFETALRDPIFYQFYKRITFYFLKFKSHLPHYTYTQLNYPGVKIESVSIDKLYTYFDTFDFEITNALYVTEEEFEKDNFRVFARQQRLNHKPFTYKIKVDSEKSEDVVVRVFLGPKYDEQGHVIPLTENRVNFVELDKFVYTLKTGKNIIEHDCFESGTVKDRTSYRDLYKKVMAAYKGEEEFHLDMSEAHNGFPARFFLPKGKVGGQVFQFYVYVSPYQPAQKTKEMTYNKVYSAGVGHGNRYIDNLPFGYPFDRPIEDEHHFFVPNSYIEDIVIFHKQEDEIKH